MAGSSAGRPFEAPATEFIAKKADAASPIDVGPAADATLSDVDTKLADAQSEDAPDTADAGAELAPDNGIGNDGFCFYGALPKVSAATADAPMPAKCALPLLVFSEKTMDFAATLQIELGNYDAQFVWHPINDGDWLPMYSGLQNVGAGQMMLFPNYRVTLQGQSEPKVLLQAQSTGWIDCVNIATDNAAQQWVVPTNQDEVYTNVTPLHPNLFLFFTNFKSKTSSWKNCGQWLQIRVAVRDFQNPTQQQWGEAVRMVRLYDMTQMPQPANP